MGKVSMSDYKDKWIVLFFYPLDFTPIWETEVPEFNRRLNDFEKFGAKVIGANPDSVYTHKAWLEKIGQIDYPLIADYTKSLSRNFGILDEETGIAYRGTFIIDPDHKIRYASENDLLVGRNINEILRVLAALTKGKPCPVNWEEGKSTL
jgi:peroxiredoxin (alkyl hydroperoxide reductase subunit C)